MSFFFFSMLHKITALPPSGLGKQGDLQKNSYNTLVFFGEEGDLQKCNLHFWRPFFVGAARGVRKCKLDLSNV